VVCKQIIVDWDWVVMMGEENQMDEVQQDVIVDAPAEVIAETELLSDEAVALDGGEAAEKSASDLELELGGPSDVDYAALLIAKDNEIQALKAQVDDRTNQCVRIAADFDNFRKRTQREKEEMEQQIKCTTINELLPVVDNFERARAQLKPQTDQETNIHKSYQSVYKQLVDCLKRIGVAPMRSEGKEFDPNLHEAVMRQPTAEFSEGTVMEELQRGYMLGERVLRHALVKVAAAPEPVLTSEGTDQGGQSE
jgi:molecular chaperone GrpE